MGERPRSQKVITDDLEAFLEILPPNIQQPLRHEPALSDLIEAVLDLGRVPQARFPNKEITINPVEISQADIDFVTSRISPFGDDNRIRGVSSGWLRFPLGAWLEGRSGTGSGRLAPSAENQGAKGKG